MNYTKTAHAMILRQWLIGFLFMAIGFGMIGIYEYRLSQIDEHYQEVVHAIYEDGISVTVDLDSSIMKMGDL